jgi:ribose-phosphate pyrophosphokinase
MQLILPLPGAEALASEIVAGLGAELGAIETRRFPDGESYVRLSTDPAGREVVMVCTLARPDEQFLRLVFAARAARELGAARLTLVAPYLAYMRQDKRFQPGEALTSRHFADLISREFDALITVDPHLHRHKALSEIYSIPATALHAAPLLADWIRLNVERPLIIGPDMESEQWVSEVAERAAAPHLVLSKQRHGDRDVEIAIPDLSAWRDRQPVLIDDIVSSGRTMIETAEGLVGRGLVKPVCVAVHALFAGDAYRRLSERARSVISTNTISHASNGLSVAPLLVAALRPAV